MTNPITGAGVDLRREPRYLTLTDLVALVAGSATALALIGDDFGDPDISVNGVRVTGWIMIVCYLGYEAATRGCLAVLPAVIARRVRFDGRCRPAECLILLGIAPLLLQVVEASPWLQGPDDSEERVLAGLAVIVRNGAFWAWKWGAATSCLVSLVLLVRFRKQLPAWGMLILPVIALTFWLAAGFFIEIGVPWLFGLLPASAIKSAIEFWSNLKYAIITTISYLPYGVFGVATLRDWRRHGRSGDWVWTDWFGVAVAAFFLSTFYIREVSASLTAPVLLRSRIIRFYVLQALTMVAVGLLGMIITDRASAES